MLRFSDLFQKYLACILCAEGVSELFVCRKLCTGTQRKKDQASPTSINCPHFLSFCKSNKRTFYVFHVLIYSIDKMHEILTYFKSFPQIHVYQPHINHIFNYAWTTDLNKLWEPWNIFTAPKKIFALENIWTLSPHSFLLMWRARGSFRIQVQKPLASQGSLWY